jgi:ribosomal protein S18 acetylase RimI-like enzyme
MKLTLDEILINDRLNYLELLMMADENEEIVKAYMNDGDCFAIQLNDNTIGVALFIEQAPGVIELKNIAILPEYRGKGFGKEVILNSFKIYKSKSYNRMIVGTANSSIENIAFYQKIGFRMLAIKRDFFANYPDPIFENGIRALDMLLFEKLL